MTKSQNNKQRIQYLDGLRGLAAILIVLHHYAQAFLPGMFSKDPNEIHLGVLEIWLFNTPLKLPLAGSVWLFVFLILSGLVIGQRFVQKGRSIRWLKSLCLGRYIRLVGPIVLVGLISFLALKMELNFNQEAAAISGSDWWLSKQWRFEPQLLPMFYQSLVEVFVKILPIEVAYNSSLWVIPIFFLGTFLLALTLAGGKYLKKWRVGLYLLILGLTRQTLYFPLIIGISLGEGFALGKIKATSKAWVGVILLMLGIYMGTYPTWSWPELIAGSWYGWLPRITMGNDFYFYHALGATLLILALIMTPVLRRFLENKVWLGLGRLSYSLYVVHILIINTLASFLLVYLTPRWGYAMALIVSVSVGIGVTLPLSRWVYRLAERH